MQGTWKDRPATERPQLGPTAEVSGLLTLAVAVIVVGGLYFGRDIFVPLALAVLLSFALAPCVRWLRRWRVPNTAAVLLSVTLAFIAILAMAWIVTWQVMDLGDELPAYQRNIEAKIEALRESPPGGRLLERATRMFRDIAEKVDQEAQDATATDTAPGADGEPKQKPVPVTVREPSPTSLQLLESVVGPVLSPLATAGIVIVFVVFMLLKREDLRDRLIRLAGSRDLPRTTRALDDAAARLGRYLLMQLVVNTLYGIPIGIGLWVIGVPNPVLWGMLCTLLRFVPYVGPIIASFFPLMLAIAVDPGWTMLLWTGALFIAVELATNNLLEPWLYGSSTGLAPLAIIAAAVFWTWLWGPAGLLLSTPLTVCLVVLGRHVPQLAFFDVLLGSEPVLAPAERLYQRLLSGNAYEATERAEEFLRTHSLVQLFDEVVTPALELAEVDRARGVLDEERRGRVADGALVLVDNLAEWEGDVWRSADSDDDESEAAAETEAPPEPPDLSERHPLVISAGARGNLDEAAAAMLGQLLERQGAEVRLLPLDSLRSVALREAEIRDADVVALSYMNADSLAHARFLVRRLRRLLPHATIVVGLWTLPPEDIERRDPLAATGADQVATTIEAAALGIIESLATGTRPAPRPAVEPDAAEPAEALVPAEAGITAALA